MTSASLVPRTPVWQAILHFDRSKSRPWMGFRHTLGIVVPLILGALAGNPAGGMVAALGALNVAVGDGSDSYPTRARRMLLASLFCALAVAAGGIAGHSYAIDPILAVAAFIAGITVSLGTTQADLGTITLVTLIVFSAKSVSPHQALINGAEALGGGLFQTALTLALWPFLRRRPEARALSNLYLELARASSSPITEAPPASRESTDAQQALSALDARDSLESERFLALLSQAERIRLSLLTLARLRTRLSREPGVEAITAILDRFSSLAADILRQTGETLAIPPRSRSGSLPPPEEWIEPMAECSRQLRSACRACPAAVADTLNDARALVDALAGQLRTVRQMAAQTTTEGLAEFARHEATHPWKLRVAGPLSTLSANLRLRSPAFRHAVRLAACVVAGEILARELHTTRPYWVPMTIALVLKPDFTTTFSRGWQRLLGTLVGLFLASVLFHLLHPSLPAQIALIALFAFVLRAWGPANYGILAIGVTGLVVFLFGITGVSPMEVVWSRGLNTIIGGLLALAAYRLWPTWEHTVAPEALAAMLEGYRDYFRSIRDAYLHQEQASGGATLDRARLASRVGRSNFEASVARMRAEPGTPPARIAQFNRILADSHRLAHAMMALEAGLLTSTPAPGRRPFQQFSDDVIATLTSLASALRDPSVDLSALPDLREEHHALLESGDAGVPRYALVNIETDRIVNSVNTLRDDIRPLAGQPESVPVI